MIDTRLLSPKGERARRGSVSAMAALIMLATACAGDALDGVTTTGTPSPTSSESRSSTTSTGAQSTTSTDSGVATTNPVPPGWTEAVVIDVIDGDTIDVRLNSGGDVRVRLIGINSPEDGECFATEAASGLRELVEGQAVYLEPDATDRDQFGRLLRYVWSTDLTLVNVIAVEEGWALAREYPPDTLHSDVLAEAEDRAVGDDVGLWAPSACGGPIPPDIQIVHVEYDAPGDDNVNQNGEWVEISNADDVPVDLTRWTLKDESASHRFSFPDEFTLQPAGSVRVYTGCGTDTADSLYWCVSGSAVWNNSGDTAFLLDPAGNIVYSLAYG